MALSPENDTEFVINTILSTDKSSDSSSGQKTTDEIITKLVTFYEDRLSRQKAEMKDEFMRLLSSSKPEKADSQAQCEINSDILPIDNKNNESSALPADSNNTNDETSSKGSINIENQPEPDVIEVDIRPVQSVTPLALNFQNVMTMSDDSTSKDKPIAQAMEMNPVLMMMMNLLENGGPQHSTANEEQIGNDVESIAETATPKPSELNEVQPREGDSQGNPEYQEVAGTSTATSFYADYDPANPSFMKPPSPKTSDSPVQKEAFLKREPQPQNLKESRDIMSPTSSNSIRVQLHEKHQKQMDDLKAYYEEEIEDLREKLREIENKHTSGQLNFSAKCTTPSPKKNIPTDFGSPINGAAELERECSSLKLKVEWLDQANKNLTQRLKDAESQVDEVATKLSAYTLRVADTSNEVEELRQDCRRKDEEIDRLTSRNNRLLMEMDESARMVQIKDQSLSESDAMLNRLMREFHAVNKEFESLKYKHESCENIIADSKQELTNAKRQMNKMAFEFKRLEHENDLLTKRLHLTTSFNVAERFSSPQNIPAKQVQISRRSYEDKRDMAPAGLSSTAAHSDDRKYNGKSNQKAAQGAPYALFTDDTSDSTDAEKDVPLRSPVKVSIDQDLRSNNHSRINENDSALLRAERELLLSRQQFRTNEDTGSAKSSPRKATVAVGNDSASRRGKTPSNNGPGNMEQQFDRLLVEKQHVEASLNRLPAVPHNQTIRANKELLENQLDDIERRLASIRFALKKSHVIRSSFN